MQQPPRIETRPPMDLDPEIVGAFKRPYTEVVEHVVATKPVIRQA